MEWREENHVDELIDTWTPPEVLEKYYSFGTTGYDKFGCAGIHKLYSNYHFLKLSSFVTI